MRRRAIVSQTCALALALSAAGFSTDPARAAGFQPDPPTIDAFQAAFFDDATFTIHARSYLFDEEESSGTSDPAAWALGGWLGYRTGWIGDVLRLGVVGYTSQPLWAPADRSGSQLLLPDQKGFSVIGQAYAAVRYEDQLLTLGRQLVNQPEVNEHDSRMVPNTFMGGTLGGALGLMSYYTGVLSKMKRRDADHFINMADVVGVQRNELMYLASLELAAGPDATLRSSAYLIPNVLASSYSDGSWTLEVAGDVRLHLAGQFMIQGGVGDELLTGPGFRPWIAGTKGALDIQGLTLTAAFTVNGTDDEWQAPYGVWPGYSHMLIKNFYRAGEQAVVAGMALDGAAVGMEGFSVSVRAAFDTAIDAGEPTWREYDVSARYGFAALSSAPDWLAPLDFEAHYGWLDILNTDNSRDHTSELRLILNYELAFTGRQWRS